MLGFVIVLYGLEGIYLHVSVWIAQKVSQFASLEEWGVVNFLRRKNPK